MQTQAQATFEAPSPIEALLNKLVGTLIGLGVGPAYAQLLQVRGRKSGKLYETPVSLIELEGKRWLVAPRGRSQWVRNALAAGEVTLKRGRTRQVCRVRLVPTEQRAPYLREYLDRYPGAVQRFFSVKRGAPVEAFAAIAERYPVFELSAIG
jgi:deazaflavin-dependent oxidoreductase (nitroreductase family)